MDIILLPFLEKSVNVFECEHVNSSYSSRSGFYCCDCGLSARFSKPPLIVIDGKPQRIVGRYAIGGMLMGTFSDVQPVPLVLVAPAAEAGR
jgi:hypothetical protein